jgi:hypothetical protein
LDTDSRKTKLDNEKARENKGLHNVSSIIRTTRRKTIFVKENYLPQPSMA